VGRGGNNFEYNRLQSIYLASSTFENNTIVNNTATIEGGAIYILSGDPEFMNCIIRGNTAPTIPQISGNAVVQYSNVEGGYTGDGNIDMDPLFRDTVNDDFHLMSTDCSDNFNSPCIDTGNPAYLDLLLSCEWGLGQARSDMGAFSITRLVVGIEDDNLTIPTKYSLYQNFPNPFNPSTNIRYSIPNQSKVIIRVYDILGNEIETLINEEKPAGTYELKWNGANLPSGVYFYQLKAVDPSVSSRQNSIETKKMILLK